MSGARVIVAYLAHLSHNFRGVEVNFQRIALLLKLCRKLVFLNNVHNSSKVTRKFSSKVHVF